MSPKYGNRIVLDQMSCKNMGFDGLGVIWKCTSRDIPRGYHLQIAKVNCEGYNGPGDDLIVAGSCFVEYKVSRK